MLSLYFMFANLEKNFYRKLMQYNQKLLSFHQTKSWEHINLIFYTFQIYFLW